MTMEPTAFRPRNEAQKRQLRLLCFVLDMTVSETLRLAIDRLVEANRDKITAALPAYEAAQESLDQARQAAQAVG